MARVVHALPLLLALACQASEPSSKSKPAWSSDSQSIAVSCSDFWRSGFIFTADRNQLTEEQLSPLRELAVLPQTQEGNRDQMRCTISIVDGQGQSRSYLMDEAAHSSCTTKDCSLNPDSITAESFRPFFHTIPCPYNQRATTSSDPRCR